MSDLNQKMLRLAPKWPESGTPAHHLQSLKGEEEKTRNEVTQILTPSSKHVRFASEMDHISPKREKTWTFSDQRAEIS